MWSDYTDVIATFLKKTREEVFQGRVYVIKLRIVSNHHNALQSIRTSALQNIVQPERKLDCYQQKLVNYNVIQHLCEIYSGSPAITITIMTTQT